MPTFAFFLYLASVFAAWLFRLAYIGWAGRFLLAFTAALPPLLLFLSLPSMLSMRLSLSGPSACPMGSEAWLHISFHTMRFFPVAKIRVTVETENRFTGKTQKDDYIFRGMGSVSADLPLPTDACGLLCCRIRRAVCYDPLGLIALRRKSEETVKCTVYPEPAKPEKSVDIDAALQSAVTLRPKYGGGYAEEHDLRGYQPGDTVNSIHWKLSSKTDSVIVREPLVNVNNEIYLVLTQADGSGQSLALLYGLSLRLCQMELAHTVVSTELADVGNESEAFAALCRLLAAPAGPSCAFDASRARCVFRISEGEVRLR